jgi:hypothetical protein
MRRFGSMLREWAGYYTCDDSDASPQLPRQTPIARGAINRLLRHLAFRRESWYHSPGIDFIGRWSHRAMIARVVLNNWRIGLLLLAVAVIAIAQAIAADSVPSSKPPRAESSFHHGDWPFAPPVRPTAPAAGSEVRAKNLIDHFIAERLTAAGLRQSPESHKATLLRRVTYDLTGLPPTAAELDAFLADRSDDAYEQVVERLLASPRFGEHWAQFWLDLVRYAETDGFKSDDLRPNAYRYRDYVIDSFNADRPFDEFIHQQLAGDELEPENQQALIATGFLRLYPDEDNAANLFQRRQEILNDVTDTTSLVFIGLTMGCAQCHDHKFDDISQVDYYRLQACFASLAARDDLPAASAPEVAEYQSRYAKWEAATASIRSEVDSLLKFARQNRRDFNLEKYEPAITDCYRKAPRNRSPFEEQIARMIESRFVPDSDEMDAVKKLAAKDRDKFKRLNEQLAEFNSLKPAPLPTIMAVEDVGDTAPPTHLLSGGSWQKPAGEEPPGFPEFLGAGSPETSALKNVHANQPTTGRRSQLAHWLTRPDHPLTARVIVNRLWQQHFGRGIVATPNDFGMQGDRPTHPELLDWLSVELVESGWSLKHIHRLMVTSATYRQSSNIEPGDAGAKRALAADPDNKLLWRSSRRRLGGEELRDALLQTAGELNLEMHGRSARPTLPAGVSARYAWEPDKDTAERNRRSIYVFAKRNMRFPLFEVFDQPDLHQSCPRRLVTVTAPQSLAMLNSELTLELAQQWAERLIAEYGDDRNALVQSAFRSAYGREPTDDDVNRSMAFLGISDGGITTESITDFCHVLYNSNEFITVD